MAISGSPIASSPIAGRKAVTVTGGSFGVTIDAPGAITIAGQSVTFALNTALSTQGALTIAGQTVTPALGIPVTNGAITIAGQSMTMARNVALSTQGSITIAGQTVTPALGIPVTNGAITIAGQSVTTALNTALSTHGVITVLGQDATLDLTGLAAEPTGSRAAGRKRRKRRYFVEIDGKEFDVESAEEAVALLAQAATLAQKAADVAADAIVKARLPQVRSLGKVEPVTIKPDIRTNVPQTDELARIRAAIANIYAEAAQRAELQLLLERQAAEEDEDETEELMLMGML